MIQHRPDQVLRTLADQGFNHREPVRGVDADGFVGSLAAIELAGVKTTTGLGQTVY